jgi:hypothetical protein
MRVEEFDQLGEVGERASQPVHFVDDDNVDPTIANVIQELSERWPLHRATGVAAVIVARADELPTLVGLALDVGFRGLSLVVERVELLQAMLGRNAGVDGAAQSPFGLLGFHDEAPFLLSRHSVEKAVAISPFAA